MLMETLLLRATVWRYIENDKALNLLIQPLSLVLKEFSETIAIVKDPSINKMVRKEFTKPALMEWEMFLTKFYSHIEESLDDLFSEKIPFGVKVIDLLHCSFSANIQSNLVMPYNEDVYSINLFFETRDSNHSPPDVSRPALTDGEKLKMILKYLREVIRRDNRSFINRKTEAINSLEQQLSNARDNIFEDMIDELRKSYADIINSPFPKTLHNQGLIYPQNQEVYSEIFYRGDNYNTGKTGTVCSLKMVCDKRFLPLDYQNGDTYKRMANGGKSSVFSIQQQQSDCNRHYWHSQYFVDAHLSPEFPNIDVSRNYDMCAYNEFFAINLMIYYNLYYVPLIKQDEITVSITKDETMIMSFEETVLDNTSPEVQL